VASGVGAINANAFNCAVDGMPCLAGEANSSKEALARVMTEVSNASRPAWTADRSIAAVTIATPGYLSPLFVKELMKDIPNEGLHTALGHKGTAKLTQSKSNIHGPGQVGGNEGKTLVADEEGAVGHQWKHGIGGWPYSAQVWSDSNGGGHDSNSSHSGRHEFEGVNTKAMLSCIMTGNCFMKFRANPDSKKDFGQPSAYSYVTQNFLVGDGHAPWELNSSGTLTFEHGSQGSGKLNLAAGQGAALSKALIYYHRFGANGWAEAPNLFNPYWRAKLHPFTAQEAAKVLGLAGNTDAAQLALTPGVSL
jgi:hypothetical protein